LDRGGFHGLIDKKILDVVNHCLAADSNEYPETGFCGGKVSAMLEAGR
jgi:hypothetical protein